MRDMEVNISGIHSLGRGQAFEILAQITRTHRKKILPAKEAFSFSEDLWRKKRNARFLYAIKYDIRYTLLLSRVCCLRSTQRRGIAT
ncbi:uncharacterized protein BDW43DRAFT_288564 [Aspergillus alliaceus]|uniref:uncharacterized protein n=1 Tax=Petromyces alliaceus TaxID=209559 RepID=UPI0012A728EC|nr:uncharacterized protein BDW43DRAFT_288564 [Aspergillus alliaceus]KAB8229291.1 hypothetical protein BDW43DRAFT_288564 [Aspergillus alliaceus]